MASSCWYYAKDGKKHGPVSSSELKKLAASGKLDPEDLVWTDGMKDWTAARDVPGLVLFVVTEEPPVVDQVPQFDSRNRAPARRRRRRRTPSLIGMLFWWIVDWRFEYYLTPHIVRFTWIIVLFLAASGFFLQAFALPAAAYLAPPRENVSPIGHATREPSVAPVSGATSGLRALFGRGAIATLWVIFVAAAQIIVLLWLRVVFELFILAFNVAEKINSIDQALRSG